MAYDPNFDKVSLLLNCNGADTSTIFTDSSSKGNSVTANGNAQISTAQSKFGGASGLFDGTGDYLNLPSSSDFNFPSDFTIEAWINPSSVTSFHMIYGGASGEFAFYTTGTSLEVGLWNVSGILTSSAIALVTGSWQHVALVRSGTTLTLYYNGTACGTVTNSTNITYAASPRVGATSYSGNFAYFNGYIDDLRITKGVARYTANFTPSTSEFESYDLNYDKVSLLLHCNGTNGSTTFTDNSSTIKTVTANGNAQISTAQSKFGGASGLFDGTGDYLSIPSSADFDLGTTYTIECWVYPTVSNPVGGILSRGQYQVGAIWDNFAFSIRAIGAGGTRFYFYATTSASEQYIDDTTPLPINTWTHLAMVRSGTTGYVFKDGVLINTITSLNTPAASTRPLLIGEWDYSTGPFFFEGYIDEIRITKGVARYTSAFTPPSEEFKNSGMILDNISLFRSINFNTTYLNSFHNNLIATNR